MAFQFAYTLDGDAPSAKDFTLDTTNTPAIGDCVTLVSGKLQKATSTTTAVLGAMVGANFVGITSGTGTTGQLPPTIGKVVADVEAVYRVDYVGTTKTSLSQADIGSSFNLSDAEHLNLDGTSGSYALFTVVDYDNTNKKAYVTSKNRQLV